MCGIVGYIGENEAAPFLLSGLSRLEYRGYDSSGISVLCNGQIQTSKKKGKLHCLSELTENGATMPGTLGIGHTRWATHGEPSDENSHPHLSKSGLFSVVHNGIIENYLELREELTEKGYVFQSATDTEVIAHLLEDNYSGDVFSAVVKTLSRLTGSYALGILCRETPDLLIAARKQSPLIVGLGEHENYIASDIPAILGHTRNVYLLEDGEIVFATSESVTVYDFKKNIIHKKVFEVTWDVSAAEKGGYDSFMFKEMMEQPRALRDTILPRIQGNSVHLDNIFMTAKELRHISKIYIIGCGSSYHVGCAGKSVFERLIGKSVEVDLASEFRYRDPLVDEDSLVIVISQSGETADTIAAMRLAKEKDARVLAVVNVVGSTIAREADDVLYTWAGPEIAVATTKAYSTQLASLYLIALYMAEQMRTISRREIKRYLTQLSELPDKITQIIERRSEIEKIAKKFYACKDAYFIGRGEDYAASMEGSLKLKEISYIHSEAYAAGELKHGTISLIEPKTFVVALAVTSRHFDKMLSNIEEVLSRGAEVFALAQDGNTTIEKKVRHVFYIPQTDELFLPSLAVPPLQFLAYYITKLKGLDADKPRNLAKSVTVE